MPKIREDSDLLMIMIKSQQRLKFHSLIPTILISNTQGHNFPENSTVVFEFRAMQLAFWLLKNYDIIQFMSCSLISHSSLLLLLLLQLPHELLKSRWLLQDQWKCPSTCIRCKKDVGLIINKYAFDFHLCHELVSSAILSKNGSFLMP